MIVEKVPGDPLPDARWGEEDELRRPVCKATLVEKLFFLQHKNGSCVERNIG